MTEVVIMKLPRGRRGMTLIEVLVTGAVLSMVAVTLLSLLIYTLRGWSSGTSKEGATSSATIALQKLCNDVRDGKEASISSGSLVVTFPSKLTDGGTQQTIYDLSGSDPATRTYRIREGNLERVVSGTASVLGKGVSSATFGVSGGTVTITLTSTEQVGSCTNTRELTSRVVLRNYRS